MFSLLNLHERMNLASKAPLLPIELLPPVIMGVQPGEGACWSVVYRCVNKNDEKGYFFLAGQCTALSSFRVGKMLFL